MNFIAEFKSVNEYLASQSSDEDDEERPHTLCSQCVKRYKMNEVIILRAFDNADINRLLTEAA